MKIRFAAAFYAAFALALAAFSGTALAGGHGNGGQSAQHQEQQQSSTSSSSSSSTGDNSSGVKPSNSTEHDTHAKASSDKTKKYGNGQTAGQIATKSGHGDATLHGPGNSQPHKVNCGTHEVDVHALKHKSCEAKSKPAKHEDEHHTTTTTSTTPAPAHPAPQKVTICHKTGSATNPYVQITVSVNALKHGHTAAKGDIIPAPASGCPTGQVAGTTTTTTTAAETEGQDCTTTRTESSQVLVGVKHYTGPKGSGKYVIIHPNEHSAHFKLKHPDELIYETVTKTVTEPKADCSSSTQTTTTTSTTTTESQQTTQLQSSVSAQSTQQTAASQSSTPAASAPAAAAGGVLGATAPLNTAAKSKPAGGVLGTTVRLGHSVGSSTLPFTGLPLWIFALVAASLIAVGAVARRAGAQR